MNGTKIPVRRFASMVRDSGIRALDRKAGQLEAAPGGNGGDATPHAEAARDVYVAWAGMSAESKAEFFEEVLAAIRSVATVSPKAPRVAKSDVVAEDEKPGKAKDKKSKKDKQDKKSGKDEKDKAGKKNKKGKKKDRKKDKKAKKDKKKDKKK
jgi:hypothetical protein